MIRLEQLLESWRAVRQDTASAVEEFPSTELDFRPTPDVASFREIARHILDASDGLTGMLLAGEENLSGPEFRERLRSHFRALPADLGPVEMANALRESVEERAGQLAQQSPEWYAGIVTRVDGQKVTRMEMVQFVKEHELTHRQQLFLYLRLKGMVPATTRRRLARQAAK